MSSRSRPQTVTLSKISRPSTQPNGRSSSLANPQLRPSTASRIPTLRPKSVGRPQQQPKPTADRVVPNHLPHRLGHLPAFLKRKKVSQGEEALPRELTIIREEGWIEDLLALPNIEDETSPPLVGSGELDVVCGSWDRQRTFTL